MDITTDVELIHLMLNEFYISVDITYFFLQKCCQSGEKVRTLISSSETV